MKKLNVVVIAVSALATIASAPAFAGTIIVSGFSPAREREIVNTVANQVFDGHAGHVAAMCGNSALHFTPNDTKLPVFRLLGLIYKACPSDKLLVSMSTEKQADSSKLMPAQMDIVSVPALR